MSISAFFEPRFGQDSTRARMHTAADAVRLAHASRTRVFAIGNNILFDSREYRALTTEFPVSFVPGTVSSLVSG